MGLKKVSRWSVHQKYLSYETFLRHCSTGNIYQRLIQLNSFFLAPTQSAPLISHSVEGDGIGTQSGPFFLYHLSLASFEAHSSDWAVLGTFAFPFHPGWGKPPLVKYYLVHVDVSLIFFFMLLFCVIFHFAKFKKLIQASSHPEVGQPGIEHRYTLPRVGQVSKT